MSASIIPLVIAMLGTGGTLAALMIGLFAWLRADMRRQEERLSEELKELRQEMLAHRQEIGELRERMAHLEGHLSGIREAIVARAAA